MRSLVLYFSNTGHTQKIAEALARELDAELGEVTCARYLRWYGPLAIAWDIFTRNLPAIDVVIPRDAKYDLIVVGGPVWAARAAPPILSFLTLRAVTGGASYGLFVTCRGTDRKSPPEPAIADMKLAVRTPAVASTIFREAEIQDESYLDHVQGFARLLLPASAKAVTP